MAKMEVSSSSNLQESVQGQPVSNQVNSAKRSLMKRNDEGDKQVISSTQLPSEINNEGKKPQDTGKSSGESEEFKKPSRWWIWVLIAIFVLGGGAAAYFFLLKDILF